MTCGRTRPHRAEKCHGVWHLGKKGVDGRYASMIVIHITPTLQQFSRGMRQPMVARDGRVEMQRGRVLRDTNADHELSIDVTVLHAPAIHPVFHVVGEENYGPSNSEHSRTSSCGSLLPNDRGARLEFTMLQRFNDNRQGRFFHDVTHWIPHHGQEPVHACAPRFNCRGRCRTNTVEQRNNVP